MNRLALLLAVAAAAGIASADEVYLKSGGKLSGKVVSRSATTLEVEVGAGKIGVPVSSVLRVEEGRSPLQEYEERAGKLAAKDVDGWVALGDWATAQGLGTQAREAYHRALSASPGDPRANAALGHAQVDGRWVSAEEGYKAKGYVLYGGEWMTPAEQARLQQEDALDQQRRHERAQSQAAAREAEARAAEAEAKAREAEAQAEDASEGLPLWYGWGTGPTDWPDGNVRPVPPRPPTPPRPPNPPQPLVRPHGGSK